MINLRKISERESEIANTLNQKRVNAYLDIYKETDFSGLGILIDEELNVYKYMWNVSFNRETHNFSTNNYLYQLRNKITYEQLENYLIKELNIIEKKYSNNSTEMERYNEIIKLKTYVNELFNKELFEQIKDKLIEVLKEEI